MVFVEITALIKYTSYSRIEPWNYIKPNTVVVYYKTKHIGSTRVQNAMKERRRRLLRFNSIPKFPTELRENLHDYCLTICIHF